MSQKIFATCTGLQPGLLTSILSLSYPRRADFTQNVAVPIPYAGVVAVRRTPVLSRQQVNRQGLIELHVTSLPICAHLVRRKSLNAYFHTVPGTPTFRTSTVHHILAL